MIDRFERFSHAISEINRCWHKIASEEMEAYGLKGAHATYLTALRRHEGGLTAPQLSEICGKDKADVSRMMALLEKKAMVEKVGGYQNGYGGTFVLTEEGMKAAEHVQRRASLAVELAGQELNDEQRAVFYAALETITLRLREISRDGLPA